MDDTRLKAANMKQALEAPDEYVDRMKREGKEADLTGSDKLRGTTIKAVRGFAGMLGLGKKKPEGM